jgi:hypothetical protein
MGNKIRAKHNIALEPRRNMCFGRPLKKCKEM